MSIKPSWRTRIKKIESPRARGVPPGCILSPHLTDDDIQMVEAMIARGERPDERFFLQRRLDRGV